MALGLDSLLLQSGGNDNQPDLRDYPVALNTFIADADALGGVGTASDIISQLTVTGSEGTGFIVSANSDFYTKMLKLAGKRYLVEWQPEGPDATYMSYNMGSVGFNNMKGTFSSSQYPERSRLGLVDWAIHYEIRTDEYGGSTGPRPRAHSFEYRRIP